MMAGDFEALYADFYNALFQFTLKRVNDREAAEDILQEVFLRIHIHIDSLLDESKLQSWMYQITRNAIIDYYRKNRANVELVENLQVPEEDEPDGIADLAPSIRSILNCLEPKYREALLLTEFEGLTQLELADRLHISLSGAKSRVQRARQKLKEALLACCSFELDHLGGVISHHSKCSTCSSQSVGVSSEAEAFSTRVSVEKCSG